MRQSRKQSVVLLSDHRLIGNDVHQSLQMGGDTGMQASGEWPDPQPYKPEIRP